MNFFPKKKYVGFGILSIDSIGKYDIILNFSYYNKGVIFKECVQKAWGGILLGKNARIVAWYER